MKHPACTITCLFVLLIGLLGCRADPASLAETDPFRDQIDALAKPYIDGQYITGMSVGLVTPEGRYTYHYGVTRDGGPTPDDDTLYEIGSITKTMTGLLLADGVTRGQYELDTSVEDLLDGEVSVDRRITLRRLATHTSGLTRLPADLWEGANPVNPYAHYSGERLVNYLDSPAMESEPGTKASYSNLGAGLLGFALAQQAGTDYPTLLREHVFEPLGMDDSTVQLSAAQASRMAAPYNADGDPNSLWDFDALAGAGGVRSDIQDMLTYAEAQLHPEQTPLAEAISLSQQVHNRSDEASFGNPMGLGWFIVNDGDTLTHGGQTGGFHCDIMLSPSRGLGLVVLTNNGSGNGERFAMQVVQALGGDEVTPIDLPVAVDVSERLLDAYAGRYVLIGMGFFDITHEAGKLYAQVTSQQRYRLYPEDEDTFNYRAIEASIDFERDEDGEVVRLVLHQNGRDIQCPRVPEDANPAEAEPD